MALNLHNCKHLFFTCSQASARLMVVGSSTSGGDASLIIRTGSSLDVVCAKNDGKVGVGTNTPSTALHVIGTVTATGFSGNGSGLTNISASSVGANSVSSSNITDGSITGSDLATTLSLTSKSMDIGSVTVNAGNFRVDSAGSMTATTITATGSMTATAIIITGTLTQLQQIRHKKGGKWAKWACKSRKGLGHK